MLSRQSVRVTYAHKRRRVQNASNKLLSSPLEVLPPDMDDLTRTQMARRMLKRSRRVALADRLEDKSIEHIREHLAKRIKHTQERVSNVDPTGLPSNMPPPDDITFQTPLHSSQSVHELAVVESLVPEQLSPVPVAKRAMSRTNSRNLKENGVHSQTLASPFSSRPGSVASSPKHKRRGRSSRRVLCGSLPAKSRTLSGAFKENTRRVSRKGSTASLKDTNREPPTRHIKHQRYPSSPSTSYMRSQFAQEDWIAPPKAFFRTFHDYDEVPSPSGSVHSNASFYSDRPQACSTPAPSRLRKLLDLHGRHTKTDDLLASFSLRKDFTEAGGLDVEMMDDTVPPRRQIVHLSGNSIFSSSDEFTIESLPPTSIDGRVVERNNTTGRDEAPARIARQAPVHREVAQRSQAGRTLAGSFVAEYDIPLSDLPYSPASTAATKMLGLEGVPEASVGRQSFGLPGTSPAHGKYLIIRTSRNSGKPTSPPSPPKATAPRRPSSPASDLALEFQSMDIFGDADIHSDGETHRPSISIPRSRSLQDNLALTESATNNSAKQGSGRKRAGTIRASDFDKPGVPSSCVVPGSAMSSLSNVRRTRSGTVVGPDSKLAAKGTGVPSRAARIATGPAAVQSRYESESDDELLLKGPWIEDLEYLGLVAPRPGKDVEADEMNLGDLWHELEFGPPRRLGLRPRRR